MTLPLRSEGWTVQPAFVPHGPTAPVTLLADETGLTQLAGEPAVAWQTPWLELTNLQLLRFARGMALFGTAGGVRYCWRHPRTDDFDAWRSVIREQGGDVTRRANRASVWIVAGVVLLSSFAGGLAAIVWQHRSNATQELALAQSVNLTLRDLPTGWNVTPNSALSYIIPPSTEVVTSTTTTAPPTTSPASLLWRQISLEFQRCIGVSPKKDRIYGAAGQMPDYQVSSKIFSSTSFKGIEIGSTTQYYSTTTMVQRDVAEMSLPKFGSCFSDSNASLVLSSYSGKLSHGTSVSNWQPTTFVHGWSRGGVTRLSLPGVSAPLYLVMVVAASGHFETTFGAIVASWPESKAFLASQINTLLTRMTSSTGSSV